MGMANGFPIRSVLVGASLAMLTAACAQATPEPLSARTGEGAVIERSTPQRFDPLVITVVLRSDHVASGGVLRSLKIVENPSDTTVTDPSCDIGAGRYALVPVSEPDAELWVQPVVDCSGAYKMEPGFRGESSGPEFPAHTKYGDPLPPGEYLAVLEIEGLSERLEYPVTVE